MEEYDISVISLLTGRTMRFGPYPSHDEALKALKDKQWEKEETRQFLLEYCVFHVIGIPYYKDEEEIFLAVISSSRHRTIPPESPDLLLGEKKRWMSAGF